MYLLTATSTSGLGRRCYTIPTNHTYVIPVQITCTLCF